MSNQPTQRKAGWGCLYILIIVGFAVTFFSALFGRGSWFWAIAFGLACWLMVRHAQKNERADG